MLERKRYCDFEKDRNSEKLMDILGIEESWVVRLKQVVCGGTVMF